MAIRPVRGLGWLGLQPIPRSCVCMCVHVCKHFFYAEYSAEVTIGDFLGKNRYSITLFFPVFVPVRVLTFFVRVLLLIYQHFCLQWVSTSLAQKLAQISILCWFCAICVNSVLALCQFCAGVCMILFLCP